MHRWCALSAHAWAPLTPALGGPLPLPHATTRARDASAAGILFTTGGSLSSRVTCHVRFTDRDDPLDPHIHQAGGAHHASRASGRGVGVGVLRARTWICPVPGRRPRLAGLPLVERPLSLLVEAVPAGARRVRPEDVARRTNEEVVEARSVEGVAKRARRERPEERAS